MRIFDGFYEGDMASAHICVEGGTLIKKNHHEIRGPKKSIQKLGLAVDTGIGRDPFSDPVLSHFLHFFYKKFVLVEGGKIQHKSEFECTSQHVEWLVIHWIVKLLGDARHPLAGCYLVIFRQPL